ncbi:hypothetical protein MNBD_GAMMA01-2 [hydrothermal vent metagenome]|uniref:Tetratricopeptide repeat protein n=1 Tax=hydrothermal vent metagenome TaxID=652676 RepID=A0A3B0USJ6_9ZZZZ
MTPMTHKRNLFAEIIARRVPHIMGMYIAAVWIAVEIADWMSDRFTISAQFSPYVFVGMLTFLPSIIMLAWGHGRPGKDSWSKLELSWIPINIAISIFAINVLVMPQQVDLVQETNNIIQTASTAPINTAIDQSEIKPNSSQSVLSFFWQNKTGNKSLDWLGYGSSWLFSQDLKRTPMLSVQTPYDSTKVFSQIINKGFKQAVDVPLPLALQIAKNLSKKWFLLGSFKQVDSNIEFTAKLYATDSGILAKELIIEHKNWLAALDEISYKIGAFLLESNHENKNIIPDLAIQDHTSNNIDAIKHLILAKNRVAFDNDYTAAIKELELAINLDESFAVAHVLASSYYQAQGDFPKALEHSELALSLDYKLYAETAYALKATLYSMSGEHKKALLVIENWATVFPKSTVALTTLGRSYLMLENRLDQAKEVYEKLSSIEGGEQKSLINLGKIYRLQDEQEKTIAVLEQYLAANPQKVQAYLELADAYKQFSLFGKSKQMYEQASIIGSKDFIAEIGIAKTIAALGNYQLALQQLEGLLKDSKSDQQQVNLLSAIIEILTQTGQINAALAIYDLMQKPAKNVLSPLSYLFMLDGGKIQLLVLQAKYSEAINNTKNIQQTSKPPFDDLASLHYLYIYSAMDNRARYKQVLREFIEFLESFPIPFYNQFVIAWQAKVAYWDNDLDLSVELLSQAIAESKQSIMGLYTYQIVDELIYSKSLVLFEQQKYTAADSELDFILNRSPLFAKAHYLKAKIYIQQGNSKQAQLSIQQANKIWQYADADFVDYQALKQLQNDTNP